MPTSEGEQLLAKAGEDPVAFGEREPGSDAHRLLPGRGAVEADAALALESEHPLVECPTQDHPR